MAVEDRRSPEFDQEMRELNADECVLETEVTNLGALGLYSDSAAYGETCVPWSGQAGDVMVIICNKTMQNHHSQGVYEPTDQGEVYLN